MRGKTILGSEMISGNGAASSPAWGNAPKSNRAFSAFGELVNQMPWGVAPRLL
jgi:hypothetical protein